MKTLKYYFQKAYKEKWAIGQLNFSDFSQVKGIVLAAKNFNSPIILGTSEGESKFVGLKEGVVIRNVIRKKTGLPIFLNLDHGKSFDYLKEAILAGYDMVHFDGSKLSLDENIKISKEVVNLMEYPENTIKLALVAPISIKSNGSVLFSSSTKDLAMACDSISKTIGFNPDF